MYGHVVIELEEDENAVLVDGIDTAQATVDYMKMVLPSFVRNAVSNMEESEQQKLLQHQKRRITIDEEGDQRQLNDFYEVFSILAKNSQQLVEINQARLEDDREQGEIDEHQRKCDNWWNGTTQIITVVGILVSTNLVNFLITYFGTASATAE